MTDSIENTLDAAQKLGESYRKLGELFVEQNRLIGEIGERAEELMKSYLQASTATYNEGVRERVAQWVAQVSDMQSVYGGYTGDYAEALKTLQSDWQKWVDQTVDATNAQEALGSKQSKRINEAYDEFYSAWRPGKDNNSGWAYNFAYPYNGQQTDAGVKKAA